MKRLLLLFVFVFTLRFLWAYDFKVDGIYYEITSSTEKTVKVTYGESLYGTYSGTITIPSSVSYYGTNYNVTAIGGYAFCECRYVYTISIPSSIKSINSTSFQYCTSLSTINITDLNSFLCISGLSSLFAYGPEKKDILIDGEDVFKGDIVIPEGVTIIPQNLFILRTDVTSVKLPNGLEEIGDKAFYGCSSMKELNIPASVYNIGNYSFNGCTQLKTIIFEDGTETLSVGAKSTSSPLAALFDDCPLDSVYLGRNLSYKVQSYGSPKYGFSPFWNNESLRTLVVGDLVTAIDNHEFHNCPQLENVKLGKNVTLIDQDAFNCCYKLRSIILPENLKKIEYDGFYHCDSLRSVIFNEGLESIGRYAFAYCRKLETIELPSTLTEIGYGAFNNTILNEVHIPANVNTIGEYAFGRIEELIIEDGLSSLTIGNYAFSYGQIKKLYLGRNFIINSNGPFEDETASTHTLQEVVIGDNVTSIPANTFYRCSALETVTIGSKVTSIGKDAFYMTNALTVITSKVESAPTIATPSNASSIFSNIPVYVPSGGKASYLAKDYWKNNIIIDPSDELITVNLSMPGTLEGRLRIQKVEPANVNKLKITGEMNDDDWAYIKKTNMPNMYSLDLSEVTNTSIPAQQFQSHTYLVNAVLPNGITTIGDNAFEGSNLSGDFSMPSSLEQIGNYAFKGTKIGNVSLSSNVTIGNYAFNNSKLKSITLNKCTSIGQYAFAGCSNLSGTYQLHSQLTTIPDYAFQNCSSLEGIELPQTLKTIGNGAFQNCSKLTNLEFHNAITSFGSTTSSFAGCSRIKTIKTHWMRPISTMSTTFDSVDKSNCTLYVPNGSTDWYLITTGWKEFINVVEYDETETLGDLVIADATEFVPVPGLYSTLSYTRNFSNTKWQSLYVPFTMRYEDWKDEYDVAYINSVRQYDNDNDGVIDETIMDVLQITGGELYPNMPYLIKAKTTGEKTITLQNAMLYQTEENSLECSTMLSTFTFTGTYSTIPAATLKENGYYAMGGGGLIMTNGTSNLKPFRWYMGITSRSPMYNTSTDNPSRISVHVIGEEDDMETSLYGVDREEELDDQIFNLNGQMMDASEPLTPGLYIKNGKKVIIR